MKIALWQTTPRHTITEALEALKNTTAQAAKNGAELLATPEMFIGGYNIGEAQVRRHAMQSDSVISKLHGITITYKPAVIVGMANNFDQSPTNSCIAINAAGKILGKYDKTHLFGDVDCQLFIAGTQLSKVVTLNGWRIGLAICYDVEFPEVVRALALSGTDLVVIPTANMTPLTVSPRGWSQPAQRKMRCIWRSAITSGAKANFPITGYPAFVVQMETTSRAATRRTKP